MKACIYEEYGTADVVRVGEVDAPKPKADEILVRVRAASVTTADWRFRASVFPGSFWLAGRLMIGLFRPRNPILGMDFSGVVVAVGQNVTRFRVGDDVFGSTSATRLGAHAEYLAIPESGAVVHKPLQLTHEEAAAIPFGANSALAFVRGIARVEPGQRILVVGASGGVGVWAVQLARHFGAKVTAVCSTPNVELVRSLGADRVVDYTTNAFLEDGETYDLIFDTVGVTTFAGVRASLANGGVYLPLNSGLTEFFQSLVTSWSAKRVKSGVSGNTRESLDAIVNLIKTGALKPVIDRVYPMEEIAAAHRHVEGRHKRGSVIVSMVAATAC